MTAGKKATPTEVPAPISFEMSWFKVLLMTFQRLRSVAIGGGDVVTPHVSLFGPSGQVIEPDLSTTNRMSVEIGRGGMAATQPGPDSRDCAASVSSGASPGPPPSAAGPASNAASTTAA